MGRPRRTQALGEDLRLYRERQGLSIREAAEQGGFSKSAWSKWERDLVSPSFSGLQAAAKVLNITFVITPTEAYIETE